MHSCIPLAPLVGSPERCPPSHTVDPPHVATCTFFLLTDLFRDTWLGSWCPWWALVVASSGSGRVDGGGVVSHRWTPVRDPRPLHHLGVFRTCSLAASAGTGLPQGSSLDGSACSISVRKGGREGGEEGRGEAGKEWGGRLRSGWLLWSPGWGAEARVSFPGSVGLTTCLIEFPVAALGVCVCAQVCTCQEVWAAGASLAWVGLVGAPEHLCLCLWVPVGPWAPFPVCVYLGGSHV